VVKVVTDSVSDIPTRVARELGIIVVPEYVCFGTDEYRDGIDLSTDDFYRRLASSPVLPTTAAIPPADFLDVFNSLSRETDEIAVITLSSKFGAAYNNALLAKDMMDNSCRIEVVDSLSGIMGQGLIVIAAAQLAQSGAGLAEVIDNVRSSIPRIHVLMTFDTLEYLKRGGRIGKGQALMGSLLKINPILCIRDGEASPLGRVRGRTKAIDYLFDFVSSLPGISSIAVEHATTPDEAEMLIDRLDSLFPRERIYRSKVSPVVGTHVGPHVIAVSVLAGNH